MAEAPTEPVVRPAPAAGDDRPVGDGARAARAAGHDHAPVAGDRTRILHDRLYLAVLLVVLGVPKVVIAAVEHGTSIDGGFYTDVARHLRDGDGFVTCVSLYHQGFPSFPYPTTIYPLWPLLLGFAARLGAPLPEAGTYLASFFYGTTLVFAYLWGRSFDDRDLFGAVAPGFTMGHLALLAVGVHREFYEFTSWPYTEGLAYTLGFALLWQADRSLRAPSAAGGALCGLLAGLSFLARSQLLVVGVAVAAAAAANLPARRALRGTVLFLAAFAAAAATVVAPYAIHVARLVVVDPLVAMLRFDAAHVTGGLSFVPMLVPTAGPFDFLRDRLPGLWEAFRPAGRYAYARSFGPIAWALPLAAAVTAFDAAGRLRARRGAVRAAWRRLTRTDARRLVIPCLAALAFLSLQAIHKKYYVPWNFARRQALVVLFAFLLALRHLAHHPRGGVRLLALVLAAGTLTTGLAGVVAIADKRIRKPDPTARPGYRAALRRFLADRRALEGDLVVGLTAQEPQKIAWRTDGIGYHWIHKTTKPHDLAVLAERLGMRYVLVHRDAERWPLFRTPVFERLFVPEDGARPRRYAGYRVYRRRRPDDPAPPSAAAPDPASAPRRTKTDAPAPRRTP